MAPSNQTEGVEKLRSYYQFLDRGHADDYRREELQALIRAIRAKENRLVVGLPGMGISNLLRFLVSRPELVEREIIFAYANCEALDNYLDPGEFYEALSRQLQEQGLGDQAETNERGYEGFRRLITRVEGDPLRRLVVVADQVDKMVTGVDNNFYRQLKALTDLNKRLCYIFGAGPRAAESIDPDNLLFAGRRLGVGPLNERDYASAIAEEAQRLEVNFDPETQKWLAAMTGGHPGLLRAVTSAIVEAGPALTQAEAREAVEYLVNLGSVRYRCQKMWQELNQTNQTVLQLLTGGRPETAPPDSLAWLQSVGLVVERHVFSPIFQRFVAGQTPPLESIVIVGTNTIFRNGQEIMVAGKVFQGSREVHVSRLELRLIACLKREQKIYTKDDIAAYVYYDDYEQGEAASDPRIENLVRQVRERLGEQYIKTHHGQGYEFLG